MPDAKRIVINTSPLIALVAATGDLTILQKLYTEVLSPYEVSQEVSVLVFCYGRSSKENLSL